MNATMKLEGHKHMLKLVLIITFRNRWIFKFCFRLPLQNHALQRKILKSLHDRHAFTTFWGRHTNAADNYTHARVTSHHLYFKKRAGGPPALEGPALSLSLSSTTQNFKQTTFWVVTLKMTMAKLVQFLEIGNLQKSQLNRCRLKKVMTKISCFYQ